MTTETIARGKRGEQIAADTLTRRGYQIVARNWRCSIGEIDLIAWHKSELVFVEVRYRSTGIDTALEMFPRAKMAKVEACAAVYLESVTLDGLTPETPWRIDFVAASPHGIEVIESANEW